MSLRPLLLPLLLALLLAGCAGPGADEGDDGGDLAATTPEEARGLLQQAAHEMPERVGANVLVTQGARTLLSLNGTFDNATGTGYIEVRGDAAAFREMSPGGEEVPADFATLLSDGFSMYVTPEGSLYLSNGTAFTFPPSNESEGTRSLVPAPEDGPLGSFMDPQQALGALTAANVTVESVRPTTLRGKPALQVELSRTEGNETVEPTVYLFTDPVRVARIEGANPASGGAADPLADARFTVDFLYDEEADVAAPESATRALGLAYTSDRDPFGFGAPRPFTWTFQGGAGIPLAEVEVHVKNASGADTTDVMGAGDLPTLWSMPLSAGARTQDGVTLTFTDADGDGKVGRGDTLRVETADDAPPMVVLRDAKTGTYVVPGPAFALALLALAGVALAWRRR